MAEKRTHRLISAQGRAVDVHKAPLELAVHLLEFIDPPGQLRLAGAGRPGQQDRLGRTDRHTLDGFDQAVEPGIPRGDAGFQEIQIIVPFDGKALRQQVIAGEVEIDDRERAARAVPPGRLRLNELSRQMMRLIQQEQADLRHMRAGGDVDIIIVLLGGKVFLPAEVVKLRVNLTEIPRVAERNRFRNDLRIRGASPDIFLNPPAQCPEVRLIQQIIAVEMQFLLHGERDRGAPDAPASFAAPVIVQRTAEKRDQNIHFLSYFIVII